MPLSDVTKNDLGKGIAIGAGLVLLVPLAVVTLAPLARPVLRQAMKTGLMAYEKAREVVAELGETLEDTAAEVQAELRASRMADEQAANVGTAEPEDGSDAEPTPADAEKPV